MLLPAPGDKVGGRIDHLPTSFSVELAHVLYSFQQRIGFLGGAEAHHRQKVWSELAYVGKTLGGVGQRIKVRWLCQGLAFGDGLGQLFLGYVPVDRLAHLGIGHLFIQDDAADAFQEQHFLVDLFPLLGKLLVTPVFGTQEDIPD